MYNRHLDKTSLKQIEPTIQEGVIHLLIFFKLVFQPGFEKKIKHLVL